MSKETRDKTPSVDVRGLDREPDMFHVYNADPNKVYFHAEDNPNRIRELQLSGYTVCTGKEVGPGGPMAIKDSASSLPINIPGHVLMETSRENWERLDRIKDARLKQHERDVKDRYDEVKAVLERKGLGKARARLRDDEIQI